MPYLKSVCIHSTVDRSLNYILDPEKTDGKYITSLNCMADPKAAYDMMKLVYEQHSGKRFDVPVPKEGKGRGGGTIAYNEWQHRKENTSWKQQIAEKDRRADSAGSVGR